MVERTNNSNSSYSYELNAFANSLMKVFNLFGYNDDHKSENASGNMVKKTKNDLNKTIIHWQGLCNKIGGVDPWMKLMKYKINAFYASNQVEEFELPKIPFGDLKDDPHVLVGSKAGIWCKMFIRDGDRNKVDQFLFSILRIGRALPRSSEEALEKALKDTFTTLTTYQEPVRDVYVNERLDMLASERIMLNVQLDQQTDLGGDIKDMKLIEGKWADFEIDVVDKLKNRIGEIDKEMDEFKLTNPYGINKTNTGELAMQIARTVREVLGTNDFLTDEERYEPFLPSGNANFQRSRAKGGAISHLMLDNDILRDIITVKLPHVLVESKIIDDVLRVFWAEPLNTNKYNRTAGFTGLDIKKEFTVAGTTYFVDFTELKQRFREFMIKIKGKARFEVPTVELVALSEALKVRVISKGPPEMYTTLRPIQKKMWSKMKLNRVFRLTGTPVTEDEVAAALGNKLGEDENFLNGDYADATNQLAPWASRYAALEVIRCLNLDEVEAELLLKSLTGHMIVEPVEGKDFRSKHAKEASMKPQLHGQLMGSVTSFPILCMVNAAMCRYAYELSHGNRRLVSLDTIPLLINGDDVTMKIKITGNEVWRRFTRMVGLTESVGKTYFSRRYVNINSRNFMYHADAVESTRYKRLDAIRDYMNKEKVGLSVDVTEIKNEIYTHYKLLPFVHMGLMTGMKRSEGGEDEHVGVADAIGDGYSTIGSRARELVDLAPVDLYDRVLHEFVQYHWDILTAIKVPWFMPEELGGLGIPIYFGVGGDIMDIKGPTRLDLMKGYDIKLNAAKYNIQHAIDAPWKVHNLIFKGVNKMIDMDDFVLTTDEKEYRDYKRFYNYCCVSLLFNSNLDMCDLYDTKITDKAIKALRHNERVWEKAKPLSGFNPLLLFKKHDKHTLRSIVRTKFITKEENKLDLFNNYIEEPFRHPLIYFGGAVDSGDDYRSAIDYGTSSIITNSFHEFVPPKVIHRHLTNPSKLHIMNIVDKLSTSNKSRIVDTVTLKYFKRQLDI